MGMFGVGYAFEEAVSSVEHGERDFGAIEIGSETGMMAAAGFGEENSFDAAAGGENFLGEANAFDADGTGFRGQAAAQGNAKFLEPAIVAAGDNGVCCALAGGGHEASVAGERKKKKNLQRAH